MKFIIFFYYTSPDKRQHRVLRGELYKLTTMMKKGGQARGRGGGQARGGRPGGGRPGSGRPGGGRPGGGENKKIVTEIPPNKIGLFISVNLRQVRQNIRTKTAGKCRPIIHLDEVDGQTVADVRYTGGDSFFKIIEEELMKEVEKSKSDRPRFKKTLYYRTKLSLEALAGLDEELNEHLGDSGQVDEIEVYPQIDHDMSQVWTIWPPKNDSIHMRSHYNVLAIDFTLHEKISFPDINDLVEDFVISVNQDVQEPVEEEDDSEPDGPEPDGAEPEPEDDGSEPEPNGNIWSDEHSAGAGGW